MYKTIWITIFLIANIKFLSSQLQINENNEIGDLIQCLSRILDKYAGDYLIIKGDSSYTETLNTIIKSLSIPVDLSGYATLNCDVNVYLEPSYLLYFNDPTDVWNELLELRSRAGWNSNMKIIFIYPNSLDDLIRVIWDSNVVNFVIITDIYNSSRELYTANIYKTCGTDVELETLNTCSDETFDLFNLDNRGSIQLCPMQLLTQQCYPYLYGDDLSILGGIQFDFITEVRNYLQLNITVLPPRNNKMTYNERNHWLISEMKGIRTMAYASCFAFADPNLAKYFSMSPAAFIDAYGILVPASLPVPFWISFIEIFTWRLWLCCLFLLFAMAVFLWAVLKKDIVYSYWDTVLILYQINLGLSIIMPLENRVTRLIIAIWLYYGIVMTTSFNSRLVSHLTVPGWTQEITNLNQLFASNIPMYVQEEFVTQYDYLFQNQTYHISKHFDYYSDMDAIVKNPTYATVSTEYCYAYHRSRTPIELQINYAFLFPLYEKFLYPLFFLFARGHLLMENFTRSSLFMHEYGFQQTIFYANIAPWVIHGLRPIPVLTPLNIEQLALAFVLLLLSYVIGFIILIFEIHHTFH